MNWKNWRASRRESMFDDGRKTPVLDREETRRKHEAFYADLPPLPPELPPPDFLLDEGATLYKTDDASRAFYTACAQGHLDLIRDFIRDAKPSDLDLQYALEAASHGFQPAVVRYLMGEHNVKLHFGCFHKDKKICVTRVNSDTMPSPPPQAIFASDGPALLELLRAFIDHGWHPNQLMGPTQEVRLGGIGVPGLQEVALHYPRCLRETPILKLLLDAGADPTISRYKRDAASFFFPENAPVQRKSGDILHMALNVGTRETIDLLLSHGARLEYGAPLHSLAKRHSQDLWFPETFEKPVDSPAELAARCDMAEYLLALGEDIDEARNVFYFNHAYCARPLPQRYIGTPLSHALGFRDWEFARWLMGRGAYLDEDRLINNQDERFYGFIDEYNRGAQVLDWARGARQV